MAGNSATAKRIDSDLIFELPAVSEPAIAPDGAAVAYVRSWVDREAIEARSHIELVPFGGGAARQLTAGPHDRRPVWAPDGSTLAFLRSEQGGDAGPERKPKPAQLWLLPLEGGEARKLTDLRGGVSAMTWSPDGETLICVGDVDPDAPPEDEDGEVPRVKAVNRIYYRADGVGWRGDAHRQLFSVDVATGAARQLTRGDHDVAAPACSPDGRWLAFASTDRSAGRQRHIPGRFELCIIPAAGGRVERLVRNVSGIGAIAWSPDGERLAYVSGADAESYSQAWLAVVNRAGGEPRRITDDSVSPALGGFPLVEAPPLTWSGRRILFAANSRGSSGVYSATPSGGSVRPVRAARELGSDLTVTPDGRRAALVSSTLERPGELTAIAVANGRAKRLTDVSAGYLRDRHTAKTERFTFRRGGLAIECWLTFPPDFNPSRRYPLVLEIHGGPNGFYGNGWYPTHQLLAAAGYLVLWTNPRGSSTYGYDFVSRVFEDWGGEDYLDLMAAVDHVLRRPYVDGSRLGVHGYSYGGFMTSWIVGHTRRFKAAVVAAPVTNLVSMYGTTDIAVVFGEQQWGDPPWANFDAYVERSPITYAPQVRTPVLLLHGEADVRCPIGQSEEYYVALKRLGKTVEFVRFPGGFHGFVTGGHPAMRQAYYDRVLEWFDRWL